MVVCTRHSAKGRTEATTEEDTYADKDAARDYLYSCYGYLPQCNISSGSLDQMTGDEVVTAFEHETFASFPKGNYSAATPVISYWDTFFQGIRQCYMLQDKIDLVPDLRDELKVDYKAQIFQCFHIVTNLYLRISSYFFRTSG